MDEAVDRTNAWREVGRTSSARVAREVALVLEARGIEHDVHPRGRDLVVSVRDRDESRALSEIEAYALENRGWPPRRTWTRGLALPHTRGNVGSLGGLGALLYSAVLVAGFQLQRAGAFGRDWAERGIGDSAALAAGDWWRPLTALTLHADVVHLAGNVVFGALFVAAVCQVLGTGAGLVATLLAGALGNVLNALVHLHATQPHRSLGASTAVFGAVGLLVAIQWALLRGLPWTRLERWTAPVTGVLFLAFLGVSGERTDVLAHVAGLAAGGALGLASAPLLVGRRFPGGSLVQALAAAAAAFALTAAWFAALRAPA